MTNLRKQSEKIRFIDKVDAWAMAHAHILLPICLIILIFLTVGLCYALVGASAVESGNVYNHMGDVI